MKTEAIIFDMGGVLVDLDIQGCKDAFKKNLGYHKIDEIIDACHQKGIYGDLEEGRLSADEFRNIVLADSRPGTSASDVDEAMWHILVGIEPYKVELLKRLAGRYDLYMLSNNNEICLPCSAAMFSDAGISLEDIFKECFFSFKMKALKPSKAFYRAVMEKIGLSGGQMLFIDDSQRNVDGAIEAGMHAIYYEPGSDLCALLADALDDRSINVMENE